MISKRFAAVVGAGLMALAAAPAAAQVARGPAQSYDGSAPAASGPLSARGLTQRNDYGNFVIQSNGQGITIFDLSGPARDARLPNGAVAADRTNVTSISNTGDIAVRDRGQSEITVYRPGDRGYEELGRDLAMFAITLDLSCDYQSQSGRDASHTIFGIGRDVSRWALGRGAANSLVSRVFRLGDEWVRGGIRQGRQLCGQDADRMLDRLDYGSRRHYAIVVSASAEPDRSLAEQVEAAGIGDNGGDVAAARTVADLRYREGDMSTRQYSCVVAMTDAGRVPRPGDCGTATTEDSRASDRDSSQRVSGADPRPPRSPATIRFRD